MILVLPNSNRVNYIPFKFPPFGHPLAATPADDAIPLDLDSVAEKKPYDVELLSTKLLHSKYNVYIPNYRSTIDEKVSFFY